MTRIKTKRLPELLASFLIFAFVTIAQAQQSTPAVLPSTSAATGQASEPVTLTEALRLALEEPKQFLQKSPNWLNGSYAAANPVWLRNMLVRKLLAGALLSDPAVELATIEALEALAVKANMPAARAYALFRRARASRNKGDVPLATRQMSEGIEIMAASGEPALMGLAQAQLCSEHYARKDYGRALPFCEKAKPLFERGDDRYMLAATESRLSNIYDAIDRDDEAIAFAQSAQQRYLALKLYSTAAMLDTNLSDIYLSRGQPEKALAISQAALKLELASGRSRFAVSSRQAIATVLNQMGRHEDALQMIEIAIREAKQIDYSDSLPESYKRQMEAAEAAKKYPLALSAARNAIEATELVGAGLSNTAIAEMSARFQAAEQQREIDRLDQDQRLRQLELARAQAQNLQQSAQLASQKLLLWLVALGIAALTAVSTLLTLMWRRSQKYAAKMHQLANVDSLTGVLNRRAVMERMHKIYQQAHAQSTPACLCVVDADHFKKINDTFGHQAGDAALRRIALTLGEGLPTDAAVGRLGGEEFAVLLPNCDASLGLELCNQIRERIANPAMHSENVSFPMAVSIGVAQLDLAKQDFENWFFQADRAVYLAKAQGRNRVAVAQ